MGNRVELDPEVLDNITGGDIGFNPEGDGKFTMKCQYTGNIYHGVKLEHIIEIGKFAATQPNNKEGEEKIIDFARHKGYI